MLASEGKKIILKKIEVQKLMRQENLHYGLIDKRKN